MRLNKFRSYNENDMCFYYFINGGYFNEKGETAHRWCFDWENADQFTGLHDKNGKEIYEGDILTWFNRKDQIWEVKWENIFSFSSWHPVDKCIVIGNIHQNPELMK